MVSRIEKGAGQKEGNKVSFNRRFERQYQIKFQNLIPVLDIPDLSIAV